MVDKLAEQTSRGAWTLREASHRARQLGRPILASWSEPLPWIHPLHLVAGSRGSRYELFYWEHPNRCMATVGVGIAHLTGGSGAERYVEAKGAWQALLRNAVVYVEDQHYELTGPTLLGGFSFDPARPSTSLWQGFPACRLVLPRLMVTSTDEAAWMTTNVVVHPDAEPGLAWREACKLRHGLLGASHDVPLGHDDEALASSDLRTAEDMPAEEWQALVSDAAQAIRSGHLEKLVLARSVRISGGRFDPYTILSRLRVAHPGCVIFAIAHHDRIFLGATPEQLVRLNDGAVEVPALAGTRRRGVGEQEDVWLGNELLTSPKERSEHEVVVRAITERLSDVCDRLNIPKQPVLLKLRQVQHLHTPISGRLSGAAGVLDLIERLHPTPAVGGVPQEAALTFLRQREHLDRGWYAAPIGWVNHDGDGEFAVAIRSALLSERQADGSFGRAALYAGCGIMGDSDPASEFAESCSKLAAMFSVLDA